MPSLDKKDYVVAAKMRANRRIWVRASIFAVAVKALMGGGVQADQEQVSGITFPANKSELIINCTRAQNLIFVPVEIDSRIKGVMLLDTGASDVVIDNQIAADAKMTIVTNARMASLGSMQSQPVYAVESMAIGDVKARKLVAGGADLSAMRAVFGKDFIGIVGMSLLKSFPFKVDFNRSTLTIYNPSIEHKHGGVAIPAKSVGSSLAVQVKIENEANDWFTLDTGSSVPVILERPFAELHSQWLAGHEQGVSELSGAELTSTARQITLQKIRAFETDFGPLDATIAESKGGTRIFGGAGSIGVSCFSTGTSLIVDSGRKTVWAISEDPTPEAWKSPDFACNATDRIGTTPLKLAAKLGDIAHMRRFVQSGCDVNQTDIGGYGPLHAAVMSKNYDAAKWLIENGANVNLRTADGKVPLLIAARAGSVELVNLLMQAGADINIEDKKKGSALLYAASSGSPSTVKALLDNFKSKKQFVQRRMEAFIVAIARNDVETANLLYDENLDLSWRNETGDTALHIAARGGALEAAKFIIERKVSVDVMSGGGLTPLQVAAGRGQSEIVGLLLDAGANPKLKSGSGKTAIEIAGDRGNLRVVNQLYLAGVQDGSTR